MNPHCQCPAAGFCSRHKMTKSERMHALCKGTAKSTDCGLKYWNAWEKGGIGATAPEKPVLQSASFCLNDTDRAAFEYGERPAGTGGGCGGCGSSSTAAAPKKKDLFTVAVSFGSTLASFAKDGFKFATGTEKAERLEICGQCPAKLIGMFGKSQCEVCSCFLEEKASLRVSYCPTGKWFIERPVRELEPNRHLLYFVAPVHGNGIWQRNIEQLLKRIEQFDGVRSIAVAIQDRGSERKLDTLEQVQAMFEGVRVDNWLVAPNGNKAKARESLQWRALLDTVKDAPGATFFGHSKGVTREHGEERIVCGWWTDASYETCLDDPASITRALSQYSMVGPFKRYGMFAHTTYKWHFSGTFFWFRNDDVFSRGWDSSVRIHRVGVEAWPGWLFSADETACIFGDNCGNPYDGNYWRNTLIPQLEEWRRTRR